MLTLFRSFAALRLDRRGVTALEYGIIAALVAVVLITGFTTLGTNLSAKLTTINNAL